MSEKVCDKCGTTLSAFYQTGMLGCPQCYKVFTKEIIPLLNKIQGSNFHVGKTPVICGVDKELLFEYERLKKEKELAGIEGRFQDMAEYSRSIFELQAEIEKRGLL